MSRKLAAQGKEGEMELQHCDACGAAIYPPQEICPSCLSGDISWRAIDGLGEVLVESILSHSFDPAIAASLPLVIVTVRLDVGPVVIAYGGDEDVDGGDRVCLTVDKEAAGGPALRAKRIEWESQK